MRFTELDPDCFIDEATGKLSAIVTRGMFAGDMGVKMCRTFHSFRRGGPIITERSLAHNQADYYDDQSDRSRDPHHQPKNCPAHAVQLAIILQFPDGQD